MLLASLFTTACAAADGKPERLAVITAAGGAWPGLDLPALANIFRRTRMRDEHGNSIIPVNLPVTDPARRAFSAAVFAAPPESMQRYWNEQYFRGVSPPYVLASPAAVVRFVISTPGAVGYVPDCGVETGLQVLLYLPVAPDLQEQLVSCSMP